MKKESGIKHDMQSHALHDHHKTPDELAPLEEQRGKFGSQGSNNGGAIVVDNAALKLPSEFTGKGAKEKRIFGFEPVAFVIVTFAILFISFITYLISIEPPKTDEEPKPAVEAKPK
jgi:hypothetical protein